MTKEWEDLKEQEIKELKRKVSSLYKMIEPYGLYVAGRNQRIGGKR